MILASSNIKPQPGFVLVDLPLVSNTVKTKSGIEFTFDSSYEKERHATITGTIVALPDYMMIEANERDDNKIRRVRKRVECEVMVGDKVFFENQAIEIAKQWTRFGGYWERAEMGGIKERKALIPYNLLILAKRGEQLIPLNDHVIAKRLKLENISNTAGEIKVDDQAIQIEGQKILLPAADFSELVTQKSPYQEQIDRIKSDPRLSAKNKEAMMRRVEKYYQRNPQADVTHKSGSLKTRYAGNKAEVVVAPAYIQMAPGTIIIHEAESDIYIENSFNKELEDEIIYMKVDDVFCIDSADGPCAYGNKVIILPDEAETEKGGFIIPERFQKRGWTGRIASKGPLVTMVDEGDRVHYNTVGATQLAAGEMVVRELEIFGTYED